MKKLIAICFTLLLLVVGCTDTMNTPSKKVEEFLGKYQKLDDDVLTQLDVVMDNDTEMNDKQKKDYRALMEKQYQNLSYKITDEKIDGDTATVDAEIEVFDYATSIKKSKEYYDGHKDEFKNSDDKNSDNVVEDAKDKAEDAKDKVEDAVEDVKDYVEYKLKALKNVTDKTTYTITFNLTKEDDEWKLQDISDTDRQKLHGLY